ncbi:MAG TPA: hypothetical protein VIH47_07945 [Solirubrobacterales bacterium]
MTVGPDQGARAVPGGEPAPGPAPLEPPTQPLQPALAPPGAVPSPASPTAAVPGSMVAASGDQCPTCGSHMAADQRYCLNCGHRRGDPRLPFMDAVVFMDAVNRPRDAGAPPTPPPSQRPRMSANASLIAGIATLILAIGVGVLIGRSGDSGSAPVANNTPQVIKVENGGGGASEATSESSKGSSIGGGKAGGKNKQAASPKQVEKGAEEAQDEVLKTNPNVNLAPPTQEIGGKCEKGQAGCSDNGKFEGNFFGE